MPTEVSHAKKARKGPPSFRKSSKICLVVHQRGVKFYGNRDAFRLLSQWLDFISTSPAKEYFECHTALHLAPPIAAGPNNSNYWVLFDELTNGVFEKRTRIKVGFDINFMTVEDEDLERMEKWRNSGKVPTGWLAGKSE